MHIEESILCLNNLKKIPILEINLEKSPRMHVACLSETPFPLHIRKWRVRVAQPARCASNLTRSLLMFPLAVVTRRSYHRLSHWLLHFRQLPVYIRRTASTPYPDKTRTCSSPHFVVLYGCFVCLSRRTGESERLRQDNRGDDRNRPQQPLVTCFL